MGGGWRDGFWVWGFVMNDARREGSGKNREGGLEVMRKARKGENPPPPDFF